MLLHPAIDNLKKLRLAGMAESLEIQANSPDVDSLSFEERLNILIENELMVRENRRLKNRLKKARFRQNACLPEVRYQASRGIDRSLLLTLETCGWIDVHRNILIIGATGTGKTFIAEALAHNACMKGYTAHHLRLPRFFRELMVAKADGRYLKWMTDLMKFDVLLLDDFGFAPLSEDQRRDLLEIIDDRHGKKSTIITSQLPVSSWHDVIGDKTLADAILDRVVHNAYRIQLTGDSMRKIMNPIEAEEKNCDR